MISQVFCQVEEIFFPIRLSAVLQRAQVVEPPGKAWPLQWKFPEQLVSHHGSFAELQGEIMVLNSWTVFVEENNESLDVFITAGGCDIAICDGTAGGIVVAGAGGCALLTWRVMACVCLRRCGRQPPLCVWVPYWCQCVVALRRMQRRFGGDIAVQFL